MTDADGASDTALTTVTVNIVAPTVDAGPDKASFAGQAVTLTATFTDPGSLDTHTATIDWGDGIEEEGVVDQGTGSVSGSHT